MPLHEAVVEAVAIEVGGKRNRAETKIEGAGRTTGKYGYPDVMLFPYVWEVKPDSVYGHTTGVIQMDRYTKDGNHFPGWPLKLEPIKYGNGYIYTRNGSAVTDEASAMEFVGKHPALVEGTPTNIKVTRPMDLWLARAIFLARKEKENNE